MRPLMVVGRGKLDFWGLISLGDMEKKAALQVATFRAKFCTCW